MLTHSASSLPTSQEPHPNRRFRQEHPDIKANKTLTPASLLTREDICELFDISVRTTHYWIRQGRLPEPICIGAKRYWQAHHIDAMLQKHGGRAMTEALEHENRESMPLEEKRTVQDTPPPSPKPHKALASRPAEHKAESKCGEIKKRLGLL